MIRISFDNSCFEISLVNHHLLPAPGFQRFADTKVKLKLVQSMANIARLLTKRAQDQFPNVVYPLQVITRLNSSSNKSWEFIKTEVTGEKKNVAVITLNRPKALNALCNGLMKELSTALKAYGKDANISAIVLTGSEKAFAAGADIKEMAPNTYSQCIQGNFLNDWTEVARTQKPIIAAVNGYALGGGCELAMMCDIIYAGDKAKFGQPEIALGTIPGVGGTQRLTRVVGRSKAMEMCLTGNMINAQEAEKVGLVSKVIPPDQLLVEAVKLGEKIGTHSNLIVQLCKEAVNTAFETTLEEGLKYERRFNHATFSTIDCKEGVKAFIEKRPAKFINE
ncbi:probable enoyl-CoA hydratase, mitochondrial isoform X2 [Drosophila albomicans]|uniref:Probable enoyl-CoA hydratase, mitochondrial n=1 Tax=Drosophila albomicans TaxID=7291 RepID=A0A6P8WFX2_DROAB|nr:probable enoyl-CoA hydratase, mitochondrial isoform X2 [Drosophila albomicans]